MMKEERSRIYGVSNSYNSVRCDDSFLFFLFNQGKEHRRRSVFGRKMLNSAWTSVEYLNVQ